MQDGLFFGLAADEYHALPFLSASGIKNLLISPMDFWARSWMNQLRRNEDTEAMFIGRAYHKRILEGKAAFDDSYAPTFTPPDDCLRTVDDIKDALIKCGVEKPKGLKGELIEQLIEIQPNAAILDELRTNYQLLHHGKEFLSADLIGSIEISAAMIENHPEISKCFRGGYPEVTVIWTEDGLRFKSRFDYLKPRAIIDLKTFGNFMNKPVDSAIYSAMASGKYHIQAAFYLRAVKAAQAQAKPTDFPGKDEWLLAFTECEAHDFYFCFQQKGVAPLARAKKFTRGSLWSCGEVAIEEAIRRFKFYMAKHGETEPWVDDAGIEDLDDSLMPVYATEL
jgi:hypothetical protein